MSEPRSAWKRSIEWKAWELVAEIDGAEYYVEAKPLMTTVHISRQITPNHKPDLRTDASFFGPETRRKALSHIKSEIRAAARKKRGKHAGRDE